MRKDLEGRLSRLEASAGIGPSPSPSVEETEVPGSVPAAKSAPPVVPAPAPPSVKPTAAPLHVTAPGSTARPVTVIVRPLFDLGLARLVESSLAGSEGIDDVRLSALSGDSAVLNASVMPGTSVVSALRQGLPVAFDVTEADENSVSIELVTPEPGEAASHIGEDPAQT